MVRGCPTLIGGQSFDPRFEYRAALKLVANIYPLTANHLNNIEGGNQFSRWKKTLDMKIHNFLK